MLGDVYQFVVLMSVMVDRDVNTLDTFVATANGCMVCFAVFMSECVCKPMHGVTSGVTSSVVDVL
jgi:hypothetical protein